MSATPSPGSSRAGSPLLGALAMAAGMACLAGNHALVRVVAVELTAIEISALRFAWAVPMLLPWLLSGRGQVLRTRRHLAHLLAGALTVVNTALLFAALARLPLALTTALNFTAPMFTTILAALLLKERVEAARWAATAVGFAGVLIVLRPGMAPTDPAALLPVCSAGTLALWFLALKRLSATESTATITVYQTLWSAALLMLAAIPVWVWPSAWALAMTAAMAAMGTAAIFLTARAFELADASFIAPFDYSRLLFIGAIGYFAFGEVPGPYTVLGAAVIVASAIFIVRREAVARRARR